MGNKIKYNNTIVILTSNLGSADMYREGELGFSAKTAKDKKALEQEYEENKEYAMRALRKMMRPELINRLDNILVFHALTRKDVEKIFDNLVGDLRKRLSTKGVGIVVTDKARDYLIEKGYDPKNGARPLRRKIEDEVESLLSEALIKEELKKGDIPTVDLINGKLKLVKE
ncbi:ATP-dependent Clp protease ATP-binding subunit [Candidatus Saccharibacteria bacterium]|nr:ATP-dependent Clp protease ATP-binding subunit [Candidatus Saccharibacteria bacterium]